MGEWAICNNFSQQFPLRARDVQLFPSFHLSTLPATAPPFHLNVFLRVFTCLLVPEVSLMCFQAFYMLLHLLLEVFSLLGRFFGFLRGMSCLSPSFGLIHICYRLFALFPTWVGLIPVPCRGWTRFFALLKHKVKPSEVLPPWLPLFQQKGCLPVAI